MVTRVIGKIGACRQYEISHPASDLALNVAAVSGDDSRIREFIVVLVLAGLAGREYHASRLRRR
jgi:hypothetical protein